MLATCFGPLDVLGTIGIGDDFTRLSGSIEKVNLENGLSISILQLNALIEVREKTGREKDIGMLNILKVMRGLSGSDA